MIQVRFWPVTRRRFRSIRGRVHVQNWGFAVIVIEPRVHEETVLRHGEVVSVLCFPDPRRRIIGVIVAAHFATKSLADDTGAGSAIARLMLSARKYPLAAREPLQPFLPHCPVHRADIARFQ